MPKPEAAQGLIPEAVAPLESSLPLPKSFKALAASKRPNSDAVIAFGVAHSTGETRRLAVAAALERADLERGEREGLEAVLAVFHELPPDLQATAVSRSEVLLPILRTTARAEDNRLRANACDFLVRMDDSRVAYLLAGLMQDTVEEIRKKAQEGILALAYGYHRLAAEVEKGTASVPRHVLETRRYALLDALLTAVRFYKMHERPEIIAALMSLSPRGDEVLMDILVNPLDRRRKIILDILETASYGRALSFLLSMLKNAKTSSTAVEVIETRFDLEFLRGLLSNPLLFGNARVTAALGQVRFVPWLRPGAEKASQLPERLAVRAVRFLLASGASAAEKSSSLERLSASKGIALASAARFVISAQAHHIHPDKIDQGLTKLEEHCPQAAQEQEEPKPADLIAGKSSAKRPSSAAKFLSDEALFQNFVNSFDTMGKTERDTAIAEFQTRGVLVKELKRALADQEPDIVLRTAKVVEYIGCQKDVSGELVYLTKHFDGRVRSAAVRQLGKAGAYDAMKTLFDALSDRDRRVLANAIEALETTGNKQILRILEPLMKHPDNRVRANAAKAAWTLGSQAGLDCLLEMLKNPKPNMRLSGLWGVRQVGAKGQMQAIRDMAKNDPDERVRKAAELTIAELENVL